MINSMKNFARNGYLKKRIISVIMSIVMLCMPCTSALADSTIVRLAIVTQPTDQTVADGSEATFRIKAEGTGLSYQWETSYDGEKWTRSGAASAKTEAYTFKAGKSQNGRLQRCVVKDADGNSVVSEGAKLNIATKLAIVTQPTDQTVADGSEATFCIKAEGTGLSYQWETSYDGEKWTRSGAASAKTEAYTFKAGKGQDGRLHRCVVKDANGNSVVSESARLNVNAKIEQVKIIQQPSTLIFNTPGDIIEMEITATGTGLKYQWQYKPSWSGTWTNFEGATTSLVQKKAQEGWNGWLVRCVVTDIMGNSVTSDEVKIVNTSKSDGTIYTVTLDTNGGYFNGEDGTHNKTVQLTVEKDLPVTYDDIPVIDDDTKIFGGWYDNKACTGTAVQESNWYADANTTYYAKWIDAYVVTFDGNGGTFDGMSKLTTKVPKNRTINDGYDYFYLDSFSHTSKTLSGWSLDKAGTQPVEEYDIYRTAITKNTTYYAQWTNAVSVTYDANGGYFEGTGDTIYKEVTSDFVRPSDYGGLTTDDKKVFDGWYLDKACTQKAAESYLPDKNYTFYAKWADAVEVIYNANGGSVEGSSQVVRKIKKNSLRYLNDTYAQKDGFVFDGWYLDQTCIKPASQTSGKQLMDKDLVVYAGWKEACTLTYDANGGYFAGNAKTQISKVKKGSIEYISSYTYIYNRNNSLAFDGWYMDKELTQPVGNRVKVSEDTTIYAKWSPACTLTFNANGGVIYGWGEIAQYAVKKGKMLSTNVNVFPYYATDATKEFEGWYLDKDCTQKVDLDSKVWNKDTTLYAKWNQQYRVIFDANGGYFSSYNDAKTYVTCNKGEKLSYEPNTPSCKDTTKVFTGWYLDKGFTKLLDISNYTVDGNITVYAKYERGNIVTFDANGGHIANSNEKNSSWTIAKDTEVESYRAPSVENSGNKTMVGWALAADGTETVDLDTYIPTKDVTLYAVWEDGYTVTFDANGGYLTDRDESYLMDTVTSVCRKNVEFYQVSFPITYAKENYRFLGWCKDKEGKEYLDTRFDVVDKDMTIYAKWAKTVNVTFDANGWTFGGYDKTTSTYVVGTAASSSALNHLGGVDGKVISGWYLDPECTEAKKINISTYKFTEDVTLYAKWEKGILVSYDACGGYYNDGPGDTTTIKTYTVKKGNSISWRYEEPQNSDSRKVFAGWYLDKEYKEEVTDISSYTPKEDITLYAKWEDGCVVTFNAGEGYLCEGPGDNSKVKSYTVRKEQELTYVPSYNNSDPTKVFVGWYTDEKFTDKVENIYDYIVTGDVTLYAKWETGIKITYDACGGKFSSGSTTTIYVEKGADLSTVYMTPDAADGYSRFEGWYLDADCTEPVNGNYTITEEITLYAKWIDRAKVTLDACGGYFTDHGTQSAQHDVYVDKGDIISYQIQGNVPENADDHQAFDGWYLDSTYKNKVDDSYVLEKDITLYAKWTDGYKITFDAGEGYFSTNFIDRDQYVYKVVKKGEALSSMSYSYPSHDEKGFDGWCLNSDGTGKIDDFYNYVPEKDMTLYAKWVNKYRVTYDACGGYFWGDKRHTSITYDMNEGTCLINQEPSNADAHKAFDGWYLDKGYTQKIEKMSDYYPKENMTIYAKWTDAYKVTYDACGGTFGGNDQTYTLSVKKGNTVNSSWTPSYEGKEFDGWYLDAAYTKPVGNVYEYVPKEDTTFYAKWSETYKITYDACGGYFGSADTTVSTYYIKKGDTIAYRSSTPDRNISDKKVFDGWYLDAEYTKPVEDLYNYVPEKDTTFYAKWSDGYMITFDAGEGYYSNGADGNSQYSYKIVKKGEALKDLSYDNPYHDNKMFDGWCLTSDCLNTLENAYDYVPEKDTTLYAKWANQFRITYDACGGYFWGDQSYTVHTTTVKEGSTLYDYEPSNADEHKIFDGWYLDATYEHKIENMNDCVAEKDMTVYAKWADAYKLTYDACGGNFWGSEEPHTYYVKAGDKVEYRYDAPSNGDKTFLGWYLDAEYTQPVEDIYNYVPEKDTIFYAKWEEDTSSDEDDTAFVTSQSATDSSDEAITQKPTEESTTSDASVIESTEPTATPTPEVTEVPKTAVEEDQNTKSEIPDTVEEENVTAEETISEQEASVQENTVTENN